jgi:hypothetical protein
MTDLRTVTQAVYNSALTESSDCLVIAPSRPFSKIATTWRDSALGANAIYSWDSYYYDLDLAWYRQPYIDGDYTTAKSRMQNWMESGYVRCDSTTTHDMPIICTEFGWKTSDQFQACTDWYDILNENFNHWTTWMLWGNPSNYGVCTTFSYDALTQFGTRMNQYLPGLPPSGAGEGEGGGEAPEGPADDVVYPPSPTPPPPLTTSRRMRRSTRRRLAGHGAGYSGYQGYSD